MPRYLGIDYGDVRIGVALSDAEGNIAFPQKTILNNKSAIISLAKRAKQEGVATIVIGLPISFGGNETDQTKKVRAFAKMLAQKIAIPIEFENEILTTRMARDAGAKKKTIDASAAAIILQAYLDKQSPNS